MRKFEANVDEVRERMATKLERWGARIDELVADAEKAGETLADDQRERLEVLKAKRREAEAKLAGIRDAGASRWGRFKVDLERAVADVEAAVERMGK